jgi:hypothetical protein
MERVTGWLMYQDKVIDQNLPILGILVMDLIVYVSLQCLHTCTLM